MRKYGKFAALIVVVIGTVVWLATAGMKETQTYYKTITEVHQMGDQAYSARLRVAGDVASGSIQRVGNQVQFVLEQDHKQAKSGLHRHRSPARYLQRWRPGAGRRKTGKRRRLPCVQDSGEMRF